jgi:predicted helicase
MRKHILETFDTVYILDLHGSNKKQETAPDGSKDENVFDIMQGVSINLFVKTGLKSKGQLATVFHCDLFGLRQHKYDVLQDNELNTLDWKQIEYREPEYFFVQKNLKLQQTYEKNFSINDLFSVNASGVTTHRDNFVIDFNKNALLDRVSLFYELSNTDEQITGKFELKDNRDWKITDARRQGVFDSKHIRAIQYRPFDGRHIYFDSNLIDFGREQISQHFHNKENLGLVTPRQATTQEWSHVQVTNAMIDNRYQYSNRGRPLICPLYLYPENTNDLSESRIPNLDKNLIQQIAKILDLEFFSEKEAKKETFAPIDILDYIYAVLHSPNYRETYKEFLKIDFPRVPYPNKNTFWDLVALGGELRQLHLLDSPLLNNVIASYPQAGNNEVTRKMTKTSIGYEVINDTTGKVWINDEQYFDNVPLIAWEFYIGGYQPAQKWLKDRNGRTLNLDDIRHYLNIITALVETDRLMKEIDLIGVE